MVQEVGETFRRPVVLGDCRVIVLSVWVCKKIRIGRHATWERVCAAARKIALHTRDGGTFYGPTAMERSVPATTRWANHAKDQKTGDDVAVDGKCYGCFLVFIEGGFSKIMDWDEYNIHSATPEGQAEVQATEKSLQGGASIEKDFFGETVTQDCLSAT